MPVSMSQAGNWRIYRGTDQEVLDALATIPLEKIVHITVSSTAGPLSMVVIVCVRP